MTCHLTWGVCRNPAPSATLYCASCMAPIEYGIPVGRARERREEIAPQLLCRRRHALPTGPRTARQATPSQGRLF